MRKRLLVGIPLAILIVGLLMLDGYLAVQPPPHWQPAGQSHDFGPWLTNGAICTLIVLIMTLLGANELAHFAFARGYKPFRRTALVFVAALVIGPYVSRNLSPLTGGYDESWGMLWMAIAITFVFMSQAVRRGTENAMENIAFTIFIILYAGVLAGFLTKLRMEVGGSVGIAALLFSIFLIKITDTGAYFTGRLFGRHKMIPWLSPKKTWEGFVGGMATTIICALAVGHWLHVSEILPIDERYLSYPWALAILGLLMGIFSVAGDLCVSLLKRDADVKDSGRAFPGLGGVLDVLDSPLIAAPIAWLFWTRMFHVAAT